MYAIDIPMKAKTGVLVGVVLLCALLGVFWANKDDAPVILPKPPPPPVSTTPVVQEPEPVSLEDCYARAEQKYKDYVNANGYSASGNYGEKYNSLTDEKERHVNTTRTRAYEECFKTYGTG